jgi:hypothetical protein
MEPIDVAAERLSLLIPEVASYSDTIHSEENGQEKQPGTSTTSSLWAGLLGSCWRLNGTAAA